MSMPRAVRHINEVRLLDALYRQGRTTRADLARELGLMRSTVGKLIGGLAEQGLIAEVGAPMAGDGGRSGAGLDAPAEPRTGRPGQWLTLNGAHAAFIGADVGVGHLSVVALDLCGQVVHRRTVDAPPPEPAATADAVVALLADAMQRLPAGQAVQGVCLTVPGLVDADGLVRRAPVLGWQAVPLQALVAERLAEQLAERTADRSRWTGPLRAENDANAFAAAELFGRAQTPGAEALFVYLDAGVGGGIASAGRLLRGQRGQAGEIGHIHLGEQGFESVTAVQGSFESYVSRPAVLARWGQHGGPGGTSDLGAAQAQVATLDGFLAALQAQQPAALRTLADWAWWMGRGLASLISVLDPGRIVLGGPVAALYPLAQAEVQDAVRRHLVPPVTLPAIEVSALGLDACAVGGAMLLHREHLSIDARLVYGAAGPTGA